MPPVTHTVQATAFEENFAFRDLARHYPEARRTPHELAYDVASGGTVYLYPFGAVVFWNVNAATRELELGRLHRAVPGLKAAQVIKEDFSVREEASARPDVVEGRLVLDRMTPDRAGVVALTVGQSAAMEYYERIVDDLQTRTGRLVDRLERHGTTPVFVRPLHRFIGDAVSTRSEVLTVLHLLDKPDAIWDDPGASGIYDELRAEFDLVDRYQALELKLRGVQEALELVLGVARDRRLFWLETSVVLLISLEIVLSFVRH